MEIKEIRRQNLVLLVRQRAAGNQTKFGELVGWSSSMVNQFLRGRTPGTKKGRDIGTDAARKLEAALGLQRGWMDTPHTLAAIDLEPLREAIEASEAGIARAKIPVDSIQPEKRARLYLEVLRHLKSGTLTHEVVDSLVQLVRP